METTTTMQALRCPRCGWTCEDVIPTTCAECATAMVSVAVLPWTYRAVVYLPMRDRDRESDLTTA